jgi:hypothetical protein
MPREIPKAEEKTYKRDWMQCNQKYDELSEAWKALIEMGGGGKLVLSASWCGRSADRPDKLLLTFIEEGVTVILGRAAIGGYISYGVDQFEDCHAPEVENDVYDELDNLLTHVINEIKANDPAFPVRSKITDPIRERYNQRRQRHQTQRNGKEFHREHNEA